MPQLIVGIFLVMTLIPAAIIAAPGVILGIITAWTARWWRIRSLLQGQSAGVSAAEAVSLQLNTAASKLNWSIASGRVRELIRESSLRGDMLFFGLAVAIIYFAVIFIGATDGLPYSVWVERIDWVEWLIYFIFAPGIAAASIIAFALHFSTAESLEKTLLRKIKNFESITVPRLLELQRLITEQQQMIAWTGFSYPFDGSPIEKELKIGALSDPDSVENQISKACESSRAGLEELRRLSELHADAQRAFASTETEVRKTGSSLLLTRLDEIHTGLHSRELLGLLPQRKWQDFRDIVGMIVADLQRLGEDARRFSQSGQANSAHAGSSDADQPKTLEEAYRILNVPATASDEHIRRVYRALVSVWHPDVSTADDRQVKQLNVAYDIVRKARGMN